MLTIRRSGAFPKPRFRWYRDLINAARKQMTVKPRAGADKSASIVLADVGGTNVRFAVLTGAALSPIEHLAVADYKNFVDALATFMSHQKDRGALRHALFGVAGVVEGGRCALTNNPWIVDAHELRARFGFTDVHIVNDFEAIAWSLPRFTSKDLHKLGGLEGKLNAPMLALGPGTGFGVAAYVPSEQGASCCKLKPAIARCPAVRRARTQSSKS